MNCQNLVAVAGLLLHLSVANRDYGKKNHAQISTKVQSLRNNLSNNQVHPSSHKKILVKYDTIVQYGATVFSKPGVDTYSTIMIDNETRTDYDSGIYVGARDWLVKFDMLLNETQAVMIPAAPEDTKKCEERFAADECHNFIKYVHIVDIYAVEQIFVCGTFAYSPACSIRMGNKLSTELKKIVGPFAPGNPRTNMATYLDTDRLFIGLVDSENGTTKIQHTKLAENPTIVHTLENKGWLNQAELVGAFSTSMKDEYVYYVFREIAIEAPVDNIVFSRVARICKEDEGGASDHYFDSFLKTYLDCGEYNEVRAISYTEHDTYFWGTFTSSRQDGSAICGFLIEDMEAAFRGPYWQYDNETNKWEQCPPPYIQDGDTVLETCYGYRTIRAKLNYTLISDMIPHNCTGPSYVANAILNKIAVTTRSHENFTAFAGDDLGRVWKIDLMDCDWAEEVELWEVVPAEESSKEIRGLAIHDDSLIVLTNNTVMRIAIRQYPGDIIVDPTTPGSTSFINSTTPSTVRRNPTTAASETTTGDVRVDDNHSYPQIACSRKAVILIASAVSYVYR